MYQPSIVYVHVYKYVRACIRTNGCIGDHRESSQTGDLNREF